MESGTRSDLNPGQKESKESKLNRHSKITGLRFQLSVEINRSTPPRAGSSARSFFEGCWKRAWVASVEFSVSLTSSVTGLPQLTEQLAQALNLWALHYQALSLSHTLSHTHTHTLTHTHTHTYTHICLGGTMDSIIYREWEWENERDRKRDGEIYS